MGQDWTLTSACQNTQNPPRADHVVVAVHRIRSLVMMHATHAFALAGASRVTPSPVRRVERPSAKPWLQHCVKPWLQDWMRTA